MPDAVDGPSSFGTPLTPGAITAVLLGSGELGKEVVIELQRLGVQTLAVDRYPDAPAMQVAHRSAVIDMRDPEALRQLLITERPAVVIPEIEAIATQVLAELEQSADWPLRIVPTARATVLTMNREGIRRLAAEELGLSTSPYRFVESLDQFTEAADALGWPVVIKPVMSSSGKGQSVVKDRAGIEAAWQYAQTGGRAAADAGHAVRCIVEGFVDFEVEITQLTVRHAGGTTFLDPVFHRQVDGDYAESWQEPSGISSLPEAVQVEARDVARTITDALGGWGVFGVELFIAGDRVIFSEVSPRPHDTGLVTLVSQDLSEFAAHARAVLGLPVDTVTRFPGAAASLPIKAHGTGVATFDGIGEALATDPSVQVRLFGKPSVDGERRVGVVLARGADTAQARAVVANAAARISTRLT
ncbi:phosphoribosylglycinamide formyltransferase 2 [Microlunatus endophyticus]|uniref:Formate-dependent phosphoribosylglycinamide formyltransferase n=1 Tax=Microlunatus endophyticus TaxID=1716077 RepID=A0A917VZL0_9ACTN|nr:formate-dependent phosphoribosylglycinamide formyltransferase [Microlunatus endophyticus]GGL49499.1 phosphoribosylglycinamide formyltransferase 2 [Microlunatus endophyticus]